MNKRLFLSIIASWIVVGAVQAEIRITEVMNASAHPGGTSNGDWFELSNTGLLAVDITGWSWDDSTATAGSSGFGSITSISAGQSVIFVQETAGEEAGWLTDWGLSGVGVANLGASLPTFQDFSSAGDSLFIYDSGNSLVASAVFGAETSGFSFEWDGAGVSLGVSAIGENGAFRATGNGAGGAGIDVGSPGTFAVPEPASAALLVLGGAFLFQKRRRAVARGESGGGEGIEA